MTSRLPTRLQLSRARGWRLPDDAIKVDRSTIWGNPFIAGSALYAVEMRAAGATTTAEAYRLWLEGCAALRTAGVLVSPERGLPRRCPARSRQPPGGRMTPEHFQRAAEHVARAAAKPLMDAARNIGGDKAGDVAAMALGVLLRNALIALPEPDRNSLFPLIVALANPATPETCVDEAQRASVMAVQARPLFAGQPPHIVGAAIADLDGQPFRVTLAITVEPMPSGDGDDAAERDVEAASCA